MTAYKPGTTAFRHNATPLQLAAHSADEIIRPLRRDRLKPLIEGGTNTGDINTVLVGLLESAALLAPHANATSSPLAYPRLSEEQVQRILNIMLEQ